VHLVNHRVTRDDSDAAGTDDRRVIADPARDLPAARLERRLDRRDQGAFVQRWR
jgi:hypothetical protein